jgi:hypothetical protein
LKRYEDTVQIHVAAGFDELTEPAHISTKFLGLSVVFTYTDIGKAENLTVNNNKWRIRTFFGWRL